MEEKDIDNPGENSQDDDEEGGWRRKARLWRQEIERGQHK